MNAEAQVAISLSSAVHLPKNFDPGSFFDSQSVKLRITKTVSGIESLFLKPPNFQVSMAESTQAWQRPRFWVRLIGLIIGLIFLYFFEPFETYVIANVPKARFYNTIFWFSAAVAVIGFGIAHWQSFKRHIFSSSGRLPTEELVFDTLQIAILTAVIVCAGATLQAVEMFSEHLLFGPLAVEQSLGERILTIILLILLSVAFYLLHLLVRAFRRGWQPRRPPPRVPSGRGL